MSALVRRLRRPDAHRTYAGRFVAFTDALLLGMLVVAGALPVVTWFVALAAGADLVRSREERDVTVGARQYARRWVAALRSGAAGVVVPTLALLVVIADAYAVRAGLGGPAAFAATAAAVVVGTIALRVAAAWRPSTSWADAARDGMVHAREDLPGTALLAVAVLIVAALVQWIPPLLVVVAGPLCVAAAAVTARRRGDTGSTSDGTELL
ncbi:hypothetical protein AAG589_18080 [Isoptericola sp. F-RaC21]|uniref:hypothetical protein n=1 Tax=Isoptericola sp. F-RaC21 TaxID=3141452 RepID=UPI00315B6082